MPIKSSGLQDRLNSNSGWPPCFPKEAKASGAATDYNPLPRFVTAKVTKFFTVTDCSSGRMTSAIGAMGASPTIFRYLTPATRT